MKHLVLCILILLALPVYMVEAQIGTNITEQGVFIKTTPAYPEPNQSFTTTIDDYSSLERVTGINWRVNGEVLSEVANLRTINLQAAGAGETTKIEVVLTFTTGRTQLITQNITPRYLDIIVEAQTKTPSFYIGRSLPSTGSTVNLTALLSNTAIPPNNLIYAWRMNNSMIGGGAERGRNKTSVIVPPGSSFLVSLEVSTVAGQILARRTISIPSVTPTLHFYEKTSLYGLSNRSVSKLNLTGDSITMQAEPYHLDIQTYNQPDLVEWKINGVTVQNLNINPYEITLSAENQTFSASTIDFHVRNTKSLLQGARGQFKLNF